MLRYKRNLVLDVYDYSGNKKCTLYDNSSDLAGQATNVIVTTERNGWRELSFTIPSTCENTEGGQEENFRLAYLKADYRIRLQDDDGVDWFLISEPKITHQGFGKNVSVSAGHIAQQLKTKNLGLEFSDEEGNNVGTARQLLEVILDGTGWTPGFVDSFKEKRTGQEKIRSLKASAKTGAFKLISNMCDLFEAKPIYHGEGRTVDIIPMNPFSEPEDGSLPDVKEKPSIELHYGKNVRNVTRTQNTENLVTKLYVYGAFGDKVSGYCGIDEWTHPEYTLEAPNAVTAGTECEFTIADPIAQINYKRYFRPTVNLAAGDKVVWSLLDPASMSYVWDAAHKIDQDEENGLAYPTYTEPQEPIESRVEFTLTTSTDENPNPQTVTNQFSFLMDFDYYRSVELLTDEMIQTIAKYQRNMPALLDATNQAAQVFNEDLGTQSETIGSVNFCRLAITNYGNDSGYVRLDLNTTDYTKGVMYRTDYTAREKKQFTWRTTDRLRENGDPVNSGCSIVYIIHDTDPVTYDTGYLKLIDDKDNPTQLTLWLENSSFSGNKNTDHIYLFEANTINGTLGTLQSTDEDIVTTLTSTTRVAKVDDDKAYYMNHEVYFSKTQPVDPTTIPEYAWWWKYFDDDESEMYFCYQSNGDIAWNRVYFVDFNPNEGEGYAAILNSYCYNWRGSTLWQKSGDSDTDWRRLGLLYDVANMNLVATFGAVWNACRRRDSLWKGIYQYTTVDVTQAQLNKFGYQVGDKKKQPSGNYAIKDEGEFGGYHTFTLKDDLDDEDRIVYDSTNKWIVVTDQTTDPESQDVLSVIDKTIAEKDYNFDNVNQHPANIADGATFAQGDLAQGEGGYAKDSITIKEGGGEIDNPDGSEHPFYRSGFLPAYPNIVYNVSGIATGENISSYALFYTLAHGYLGYVSLDNVTTFSTSPNTRFIRIKTTIANPSPVISAKNHDDAFVANENTFYILGEGTGSGLLKGIIPLTGMFRDLADKAYLVDYQAMKAAQEAQKKLEMELVDTLGDMYREGYWQKSDYVDGDEDKLYNDGLENLEKIAKPDTKYTVQYLDLYSANDTAHEYAVNDIAAQTYWPDIAADYAVHLVDPEIGISQWAFIDKIQKCYDKPWMTQININTNLSTIAQHSFTDVMTHIADVANKVGGKMEVYDRAESIDDSGNWSASSLRGAIDANTLLITGGASSWYTDEKGNLMFLSADGKSAMMLTGNGLTIANSKNEYGEWEWETSATGDGIVADTITAGTLNADRIAAGSIKTNKLSSEVGQSLDLSSNQSVSIVVADATAASLVPIQQAITNNDAKYMSAIDQTRESLSAYVTSAQLDENNQVINQNIASLQLTDSAIQAQVGDIQQVVGSSIKLDNDGLHQKQYQTDQWEALLTSTELSFQNQNHVKVASFGADGAYADRLRSNQTLSVGTESNGWYEFTTTKYGMAEKWRDGTSDYQPLYIVEQPKDCYADFNQGGTHKIDGGSNSWGERYSYSVVVSDERVEVANTVAQIRRFAAATKNGDGWEKSSVKPTKNGNMFTVSGLYSSTATGEFEYRLAVTYNGTTVYTNPVRIFYNNAPVIYKYLPDKVSCRSGDNVPLSIACIGGATYTWQTGVDVDSSSVKWTNIQGYTNSTSTTCTISNVTDTTYVRCVIKNASNVIAISPICEISVSSS